MNVTDPAKPWIQGHVLPDGDAVDVAVGPGYAFSSNRDLVQVLDLAG